MSKKETITIPGVDVHLLDTQRLALANYLDTNLQGMDPVVGEHLEGILNMLDAWSDARRPEFPERGSKWVNKHGAEPYPKGGITILGVKDNTHVQFYRDGYCQVYNATPKSFHNSYRPATEEELNAKPIPELAYFGFDDGPMILGFTYGYRWNGWGCPRVEKESFRKWLEALGDVFSPEDGHMRFEGDDLINHDPYADEDGSPPDSVMTSSQLVYGDRTYEVYDVSNGWCWNQNDLADPNTLMFTGAGDEFDQVILPEGLEDSHEAFMLKRFKHLWGEEEE